MLTNNGAADGIYFNGNQLYVKGERISVDDLYAIGATIGGWKINKNNLTSATGNISLTKDGKIKIGSATLYSNGHAAVIKSGLTIYTDRSNEFSDGTGNFEYTVRHRVLDTTWFCRAMTMWSICRHLLHGGTKITSRI